MFGLFNKKETPEEANAKELYNIVVNVARQSVFYSDWGVPDNVDGRFDMISVHEALLICRLEQLGDEAAELSQQLFDQMFLDMDRSLREMGISDLRIPKHMKRMMNGFNGRAQAYKEALLSNDNEKLHDVIKRNIYGTSDEVTDEQLHEMTAYIQKQWKYLSERTLQDFQNCENIFMKEENNED